MATKYKPILFSTEMVKAILEGRKAQTRRMIKPQPIFYGRNDNRIAVEFRNNIFEFYDVKRNDPFSILGSSKPKFQIGNILWVREKFEYFGASFSLHDDDLELCGEVIFNYYASKNENLKEIIVKNILAKYAFANINKGWKPSIHMPKEAARIFLEVTNVRVERLQNISEENAIAEGIERVSIAPFVHRFKNYLCNNKFIGPEESFKTLWMKINGEDSWNANPWVWVYEFKVVEKPKDFPNE